MSYIVVCGWDQDNKNPAYRFEDTEEKAQAAVARISVENPEVFAVPDPGTDPVFMVVDPVNKAVTHDTDAETAASNEKALKVWEYQMAETDKDMPRTLEDVIDVLTADQVAALPQATKSKHAAKKSLRGQKP